MKKFLKRTIYFLGFLALVFAGFYSVLYFSVKKRIASERFNANIHTLFVGDSHVQKAFNDSLLPNAKNIGQTAESTYFTFYKLKHLLPQNPQIKTIYMGLGFHSISTYYDEFIFGHESKAVSHDYFFLLPLIDQWKLVRANKENLQPYLKSIYKQAKLDGFSNELPFFMGQFLNKYHHSSIISDKVTGRLDYQFYYKGNACTISEFQWAYVDSIAHLCQQYHIKFEVINTPVHHTYYRFVPKMFIENLADGLKSRQIPYHDFSHINLPEIAYIPDGDHVSSEGTILFAKNLDSLLNR